MKLCKYYSLDECHDKDLIFERLNDLENDVKIEFYFFKSDDVIKIKNTGLNLKEKKDLVIFFRDNDVIEYPDYEEYDEEDDYDDDDYDDDDDDYEY